MAEPLTLSDADRDMLAEGTGPAAAWCLRMVIALAEVRGTGRLLSVHLVQCHTSHDTMVTVVKAIRPGTVEGR
jgi:predicted aconitase